MAKSLFFLVAISSGISTGAFTSPSNIRPFVKSTTNFNPTLLYAESNKNELQNTFDPIQISDGKIEKQSALDYKTALISTSAIVAASYPSISNAAGPDWGIFEGRTGSLLHPIIMASMFLFSISTAILGFQIRRTRDIGGEISELKKSIPKFEGSSLQDAITAAEATEDTALVSSLKAAMPIQSQVDELTMERKELVAAGPRDKHFGQGVLLAFMGTAFAIEGPLNTYARAGKLFPGPHLYAGAGLVVLWSLAAACVPQMQKGSDTARSIHIAANAAGMGLFGWQVVSGWPILLKVIEKTQWP